MEIKTHRFRHQRCTGLAATLCLCLALGCANASAHVITSSRLACHWLAKESLQLSSTDHQIFGEAQKLSGNRTNIFLAPAKAISKVAHIPDAPYLTAIAGKQDRCVAVSPAWFTPLRANEKLWLLLVGIGVLQHHHTYQMMLSAAEHPPSGIFSGLARWWGRRTADHAILSSERQATQWLPADQRSSAKAALVRLQTLPAFASDHWLPSVAAQTRAAQQG
ncbi:hypothetical protein MQE22_08720 [Acidithiobacillus sp. YTS05]|nr:hypothetical protein MQE22_08720 [Acidithiobacillus sp. YTS05]